MATLTSERPSAGSRRKRWARRILGPPRGPLVIVHRWVGLVLFLWIVVESFTGAAIVFAPEIDQWVNGDAYATTRGDVGMDRALDATRDARPGEPIQSAYAPGEFGPTYLVFTVDPEGAFHRVHVDPGSGDVTARDHQEPGFVTLMERFHVNLNSTSILGLKPSVVLGWLSILWLVVLFSGFYVWYWPRVKRWRRLFKVRRRAGRYNWHLDVHNLLGVVTLVPLTLVVLTGINFMFPTETRDVYEVITLGAYDEPTVAVDTSTPDGSEPITAGEAVRIVEDLDTAVEAALVTTPGGSAVGVYDVHATVDGSFFGMLGGEHEVELAVDQYSGRILSVGDRLDKDGPTQLYDDWSFPLHAGTFGGDITRWLWVAIGLTPLALVWTGIVMWLVRRKRGTNGSPDDGYEGAEKPAAATAKQPAPNPKKPDPSPKKKETSPA